MNLNVNREALTSLASTLIGGQWTDPDHKIYNKFLAQSRELGYSTEEACSENYIQAAADNNLKHISGRKLDAAIERLENKMIAY